MVPGKDLSEFEHQLPGIKPARNLTATGAGKRRRVYCSAKSQGNTEANRPTRVMMHDVSFHPQIYRQYILTTYTER